MVSGVTTPTNPAALDLSASQGRSWFALWSGDPPDPPTLPPDNLLVRVDDFVPTAAGNWLIRGFGTLPSAVEIPSLTGLSLMLLTALLAMVAVVILWRS